MLDKFAKNQRLKLGFTLSRAQAVDLLVSYFYDRSEPAKEGEPANVP